MGFVPTITLAPGAQCGGQTTLDRLLFHVAPDIYNRSLSRLQQENLAPKLVSVWNEALRLPGTASLEDSFLLEIQEYFGLSAVEARERLEGGAEHFARHFADAAPDTADAAALERVYDETDLEIFELAEWHARRFLDGPLNYVLAMQAAQGAGGRRYLDYGSGIGSGAILLARHGFEVTLADVSSPMLAFARWRLERRGLPFRAVHLRTQRLGGEVFDLVTLLDVLEHVADPVGLLADLRPHLDPRQGLLVIRAPFDDPRPQHIPHDVRTPSRFGAVGYRYAWDLMGRRGLPIVLRVSPRGAAGNVLTRLIDHHLLGLASAALSALRTLRLRVPRNKGRLA